MPKVTQLLTDLPGLEFHTHFTQVYICSVCMLVAYIRSLALADYEVYDLFKFRSGWLRVGTVTSWDPLSLTGAGAASQKV